MELKMSKIDCWLLEDIYSYQVEGTPEQAVEFIQIYGVCDFWSDYKKYLIEKHPDDTEAQFSYFTQMTITYFTEINK